MLVLTTCFSCLRQFSSLTSITPAAGVDYSHKIRKTSYNIAKSYCPIGLINTIPKVFLTLCSKHILYS